MPFHLCGGCLYCDVVPDCIDQGCCKNCCAVIPCCGARPANYVPWNTPRCCASSCYAMRYQCCVCASATCCTCCCKDAFVCDPCAVCFGEYKGNMDHLIQEIDVQYKPKGAPAQVQMAR